MSRQELRDRVWLKIAKDLSELGTCARRKVGCVILDEKYRVLATGYNGTAPENPHCTEDPCPGANFPSGQGLEFCEAIHAEQNALIQLSRMDEANTVYCTASPCIHCVKMLARTSATRIVFINEYPHPAAKNEWLKKVGRTWEQVSITIEDAQ